MKDDLSFRLRMAPVASGISMATIFLFGISGSGIFPSPLVITIIVLHVATSFIGHRYLGISNYNMIGVLKLMVVFAAGCVLGFAIWKTMGGAP